MFPENDNNIGVILILISIVVMFLLITAIITYAFLHQKKVGQLKAQLLEEDLRSQQAIFNALQEGQEKERARLAEELHDGIGAKLSGLKMTLEYLKLNVTQHNELVVGVYSGVAETLEEVREISHNLQPYYFNDVDMEQLFQALIDRFHLKNGCRYDLLVDAAVNDMDKPVRLQTFRITSELLNNIHKHAQASLASVQINVDKDVLVIAVEDNGIGMPQDQLGTTGVGLTHVRNRVNACKGTVTIDSSGKGTSVIIEIPLNPTA